MKKLSLVSLEKEEIKKAQLKSIKGGGICACRHQGERRSKGVDRAHVIEIVDYYF